MRSLPETAVPLTERTNVDRAQPGVTRTDAIAIGAFVFANVVLAIAMHRFELLATLHAIGCLIVGVAYAITTRRIRNIAVIIAYIAGSEVLWRMSRAAVFYEFGKYSILAIATIGVIRVRGHRNRGLAFTYLALLLPSVALTFMALDFDIARQQVGFTLSGPAAIAISVAFFSNVRLSTVELWRVFIAFIGPVAGIAAITIVTTMANDVLDFGNGSNVITSGGFGPNQVSAMLGLAMMFLLLISFERRLQWRLRVLTMSLAFGFAALSALTFSRGGIVLGLVGTAGAMFVLLRGNARGRLTVAFVTTLTLLAGKYVIEPKLENMTNGKLSERYLNTQSSGRDIFAASELTFFGEHPVMGVGPGIGTHIREENGLIGAASHTEYSRMLGEHGMLGLLSLVCFVIILARGILQSRGSMSRAYAVSMILWTGLFLLIYSTRLAAPAMVLGLVFTRRPTEVNRVPQQGGIGGLSLVAPTS